MDETERQRLAACAVIELAARQIAEPGKAEEHVGELAVILRDVDPVAVLARVAGMLVGVTVETGYPMGARIAAIRAQIVGGGPGA